MTLTRVSVTVSAALPIRLKVGALPVCCQTWAWTGPADSPGRFGVIDVAGVGKGTVSVVPPVRAVARACASSVVPRMKFTIGRPKPRFAKPLPVIVKRAGGVAGSIERGVMPLTPGSVTANIALTVVAALSVTVQVLVREQPPPLQPVKVEPAAGPAVKVTAVPLANAAEDASPQEMPAGAPVPGAGPGALGVSDQGEGSAAQDAHAGAVGP